MRSKRSRSGTVASATADGTAPAVRSWRSSRSFRARRTTTSWRIQWSRSWRDGTWSNHEPSTALLVRQRIGPQLKVHHLARRALAGLHVPGRACAHRGPEAAALPAGVRIVDAAVHPLRVEAHRIRNAHHDELAVLQREQRFRFVARVDRRVGAESERVELIDPGVVAALGAARLGHTLQLRERLGVEGPPFGAVLARGGGAVERAGALATIEARHVSARECHPRDAVAVDVHAAR